MTQAWAPTGALGARVPDFIWGLLLQMCIRQGIQGERGKEGSENLEDDSWAGEEEEEGRGDINLLGKLVYWFCLGSSILKVYVDNKSLIKIQN